VFASTEHPPAQHRPDAGRYHPAPAPVEQPVPVHAGAGVASNGGGGANGRGGAYSGHGDSPVAPASQPVRVPRPVHFDDDELDVPDFLK
jgi:hypothetical protein